MKKTFLKLTIATICLFVSFVSILHDSPYVETIFSLILLSGFGILLFLIYKFPKKKWLVCVSTLILIFLFSLLLQLCIQVKEFTYNENFIYAQTLVSWGILFQAIFFPLQFAFWLILGNDFLLNLENKENISLGITSIFAIISIFLLLNPYANNSDSFLEIHYPYYFLFSVLYILYIIYRFINKAETKCIKEM